MGTAPAEAAKQTLDLRGSLMKRVRLGELLVEHAPPVRRGNHPGVRRGTGLWLRVAVLSLVGASATCTTGPSSDFRPTTTVEEIMRSMIDPAADAIWDAVVTDVTADGILHIRPETDEEWAALHRHAVTLVEATNLLVIDGRQIAAPESRSESPGIDLHPDAIQKLVTEDRASWIELAHGLHDTGVLVLDAVNTRDTDALLAAGTDLDVACENCHSRYWYPSYADPRPARTGRE